MTINVLDTSRRRGIWRKSFSKPGELLLLAEADAPALSKDAVFFIHATDFGCCVSDEHIEADRLKEVAGSYAGNAVKAREICARIVKLRRVLRSAPPDSQPVLLLYSGDEPDSFAAKNPEASVLENVLPGYCSRRIEILQRRLDQTIAPVTLRRVAETCSHSIANGRCLADDLKTVAACLDGLAALKAVTKNTSELVARFDGANHQEEISRFFLQGLEPSPKTLLELSQTVQRVSQSLSGLL